MFDYTLFMSESGLKLHWYHLLGNAACGFHAELQAFPDVPLLSACLRLEADHVIYALSLSLHIIKSQSCQACPFVPIIIAWSARRVRLSQGVSKILLLCRRLQSEGFNPVVEAEAAQDGQREAHAKAPCGCVWSLNMTLLIVSCAYVVECHLKGDKPCL